MFQKLICAAKINLAFGFVLKKLEDGTCSFLYAHKNSTFMERSKLACSEDYMTNLKQKLWEMDIFDHCPRQRANNKWKFHKLIKVTVFASLLKDISMICKNSVLLELFSKKPQCELFLF